MHAISRLHHHHDEDQRKDMPSNICAHRVPQLSCFNLHTQSRYVLPCPPKQLYHALQCDGMIRAMQAQMDRALLEKQNMQECLEKERLAFRTSMTAVGDDRRDATWKSKMMKLRAELEQVKHERDSFKRQRK